MTANIHARTMLLSILSAGLAALGAGPQDADGGGTGGRPKSLPTLNLATLREKVDRDFILRTQKVVGVESCHGETTEIKVGAFPFAVVEYVLATDETHVETPEVHTSRESVFTSNARRPDTQDSLTTRGICRVYTFIPESIAGELERATGQVIPHPRSTAGVDVLALTYASEADEASADRLLALEKDGLAHMPRGCEKEPDDKQCFRKWGRKFPEMVWQNEKLPHMGMILSALQSAMVPQYHSPGAPHQPRTTAPWASKTLPLEPRNGHYIAVILPEKEDPVEIGAEELRARPGPFRKAVKDGRMLVMLYGIFKESRCRAPKLEPDQ